MRPHTYTVIVTRRQLTIKRCTPAGELTYHHHPRTPAGAVAVDRALARLRGQGYTEETHAESSRSSADPAA